MALSIAAFRSATLPIWKGFRSCLHVAPFAGVKDNFQVTTEYFGLLDCLAQKPISVVFRNAVVHIWHRISSVCDVGMVE